MKLIYFKGSEMFLRIFSMWAWYGREAGGEAGGELLPGMTMATTTWLRWYHQGQSHGRKRRQPEASGAPTWISRAKLSVSALTSPGDGREPLKPNSCTGRTAGATHSQPPATPSAYAHLPPTAPPPEGVTSIAAAATCGAMQ